MSSLRDPQYGVTTDTPNGSWKNPTRAKAPGEMPTIEMSPFTLTAC